MTALIPISAEEIIDQMMHLSNAPQAMDAHGCAWAFAETLSNLIPKLTHEEFAILLATGACLLAENRQNFSTRMRAALNAKRGAK